MIRRHPHVFGENKQPISEKEVKENWEKIKSFEQQTNKMKELSYLPALLGAHKIGEKTSRIGFDWKDANEVLPIVTEELEEFIDELPNKVEHTPSEALQEEYGDLLFSIAQLGRHLGINSEEALQSANNKFIRRFNRMKELIIQDKQDITRMNQKEMDIFWNKVKKEEHGKA
jgi:MazG family protein